jgi:hypothetical protein
VADEERSEKGDWGTSVSVTAKTAGFFAICCCCCCDGQREWVGPAGYGEEFSLVGVPISESFSISSVCVWSQL